MATKEFGDSDSEDSDEEATGLTLVQGAKSMVTKKLRGVTRIVLVLRFVLRLLKENKTSTRAYCKSLSVLLPNLISES